MNLIKEDCLNAEMLRYHFRRAEKRAKKASLLEAKRVHELGQRFNTLAIRQIKAFADVGNHLCALMHHYDKVAGKRSETHTTLDNASTPT